MIETVRGGIESDQLGRVLMHEHVFVLSPEFVVDYPDHEGFDPEKHVARAIEELTNLKRNGIDTIVDLTVINLGRNIECMRRVAETAPVNIIAASGLYTYNELPPFIAVRRLLLGDDPLVEMFVKDIRQGIGHSGVKAGVLKCATDKPGLTPDVERVVRAVAEAHRETGVPISTHTDPQTRRGIDQLDVFESEGVDPERVVIGHSGDTTDIAYLEEIIDRGAYVGMDRFGLEHPVTTAERVDTVVELCRRGHAGKVVLSHDAASFNDHIPPSFMEGLPNYHYQYIPTVIVPSLLARGVAQEDIDAMLVDNPRRIFARDTPA
jgi:phosphotriesterase-related protein